VDSISKYASNSEVYCDEDPVVKHEVHVEWDGCRRKARLAHDVVLAPFENQGHIIAMDNFFFYCSKICWRKEYK